MHGTALVTGGAGFIGSHLTERLVSEGYKVKIIDNLTTGRLENLAHLRNSRHVEIIVHDLKERDLSRLVKDVEVVFHFAANPEVRVSTIKPKIHFDENVVATFNLLEAMRKNDIKNLIFASSSSVYGEPERIPVDEQTPLRPVSIYGASKASSELLIHAYSRLYNIRALVLRYANVVGPRLRHGVVWDFINKLRVNPRELEVLGDGSQTRSYIYIDDAIEATIIAWRKSKELYSVFNVASLDWITVNEVAKIVIEAMKFKNVKIRYKPHAHGIGWPGDVKKIALKIDRLRELGFTPRFNSAEAVRKTASLLIRELDQDNLSPGKTK